MAKSKTRRVKSENSLLPEYEITGLYGLPFVTDAYYTLLGASWWQLFAYGFLAYVILNLVFGTLYWVAPGSVSSDGTWLQSFHFSVQTFSTIGYGSMSPTSTFGNILVTIESFFGLVAVAIGTGLVFSKFSRPSARIDYSEKMVVHPRNGKMTLHFRIANERADNRIINAKLKLSVLMKVVSEEGHELSRFFPLKLERDEMPFFALSLIVMHVVDEDSPFFTMTPEEFHEKVTFFVTSFEGIDSTFLQTVQANNFYHKDDIVFGEKFVDMMELPDGPGGKLIMRHENLSKTEPIEAHETFDELVDELETE